MIGAVLMFGLAGLLFLGSSHKPLTTDDLAWVFLFVGVAFFTEAALRFVRRSP